MQIVTGFGETGQALIDSADKIIFVGSVQVRSSSPDLSWGGLAGPMFHFLCPVPVQVRTDAQTYRET